MKVNNKKAKTVYVSLALLFFSIVSATVSTVMSLPNDRRIILYVILIALPNVFICLFEYIDIVLITIIIAKIAKIKLNIVELFNTVCPYVGLILFILFFVKRFLINDAIILSLLTYASFVAIIIMYYNKLGAVGLADKKKKLLLTAFVSVEIFFGILLNIFRLIINVIFLLVTR